jgi:acetyl-CoA C-acetyltransferase
MTMEALIAKHPDFNASFIEDAIMGCANQAGEDNRNVARMATLLAGLPTSIGGETVNRLCASGMAAAVNASRAIKDGAGDLYLAGGVEQMTRAPFVLSKAGAAFGRDQQLYDSSFGWRFINPDLSKMYYPFSMGETAENVAVQYAIGREAQDLFAFNSQEKYAAAAAGNKFNDEIIGIEIKDKKSSFLFNTDEHPRKTDLVQLSALQPAFKKDGTVTAGNASGINDGASALLLASEEAVKLFNLQPMARVVSMAVAGVHPSIMGIGPVPATQKALQRAGIKKDAIDLIELNEAFASQSIACIQELQLNESIVNVNGGAIALGHPLGCSGSRISTTLLHEMKKQKRKYGLATMCIGVGQGASVIYENL